VLQRGLALDGPKLQSQQRTYEHGLLRSGAATVTQRLADL
jgi:hypothetical protein